MGESIDKQAGLNRRNVILGALAGSAALAGIGCGSGSGDATTAGTSAAEQDGKKRKLIWAIAAIAPWNVPIDVGYYDATRALGWDYQKVGVPISQYSAENHVNVLKQAILAKPDVLATMWWVKGVGAVMEEAQKQGIYCIAIGDADNFPDDRKALGIAHIGVDNHLASYSAAQPLLAELEKRDVTTGTIISGISHPGNENAEAIINGGKAAVEDWNKEKGTTFAYSSFPDTPPGADESQQAAIWKAQISKVGKELVGVGVLWDGNVPVAIKALQESGLKPGDKPIASITTTERITNGIREGWIVATTDAGTYQDALLSTASAWGQLERAFPAVDVQTGGEVVTQENVAAAAERTAHVGSLAKKYGVKVA